MAACAVVAHGRGAQAAAQVAALARCEQAGMGNAAAAAALTDHAEARGDTGTALRWWRQRRQLAGEAWSGTDQERLHDFERRAAAP